MRESVRYTAGALCIAVAIGVAPSCAIEQTTEAATAAGDAGFDVGAGGSGGVPGDGGSGWAGYGASGGEPPCDAKATGASEISDLQFVYHAFQTVLAQKPDPSGFEVRLAALRAGDTRAKVYEDLCATQAIADNVALQDKAGFVERVYGVLLGRPPTEAESSAAVAALKKYDGKGPGAITWYQEFESVLMSGEYASVARPLVGVHFPTPVDPVVAITDADFIRHAYRVLLDRDYDVPGLQNYLGLLETNSRPWMYDAVKTGGEFLGNTALHDQLGFIQRVYQTVLGRAPTQTEIDDTLKGLQKFDGTGGSKTWYSVYLALTQSAELKQKTCDFEYFVYDAPVATDTPVLRDVASGVARIQAPDQASAVVLTLDSAGGVEGPIYPKLATFVERASGELYAFVRGRLPDQSFNVFLLHAADATGTSFTQIGSGVFAKYPGESFLDPQLAIDNSVCPRRYVMGMLCPAGACVSYTTTPAKLETWSRPRPVVTNCPAYASTCTDHWVSPVSSVALFDHGRAHFGWAEMDDGTVPYSSGSFINPDDGAENISTNAQDFDPYAPVAASVMAAEKHSLLAAEPNPKCSSGWDCNNRAISDWRAEGAQYFSFYSGANYYRCQRPDLDASMSNQWGIGMGRALIAIDNYQRPEEASVIFSKNPNTCGMTYPMLSAVAGKLAVYYTSTDENGTSSLWRAAIACQ